MKYDLIDTITAAMMCHIPVVIVEGQDDTKFYDNVASLNNMSVDVLAVETIDGYTEGCTQVCNAMTEVVDIVARDERLKKYVMGIIDRDVRQYTNLLPNINNLLVLKYYSYETHLITDITLRKLVEQMTKVPGTLITQSVIEWLEGEFESETEELYYFSLEALKKMCDTSYGACIEFGLDGGAVIGSGKRRYWGLVSGKVDELDQFALEHEISKADLKYIAKGKWLLATWCDFLIRKTKELQAMCGIHIPQCSYCKVGQNAKCLWRVSSSFQRPVIESLLYTRQFIDLNEVAYISQYMERNLSFS